MESTGQRAERPLQLAMLVILLAIVTGALAWAVQFYFAKAGPLATVWLSNGVAVALLLRMPRAQWLALLPAVFLGTGIANIVSATPIPVALVLGLINMIEVGLVAVLASRVFHRLDTFDEPRVIIRFFAAALAGTLAAAVLAGFALAIMMGLPIVTSALDWWVPDILGMLTIAPFLLSFGHWNSDGVESRRRFMAANAHALLVHYVAPVLLFLLATAFVFKGTALTLLFALGPLLLIVAMRLPLSGAMLALLGGCATALAMTIMGYGPIAAASENQLVEGRLFQAFMASLIFLVLPVRALARDRDRLDAAYADSERKFRIIAESIRSGLLQVDRNGQPRWANHRWRDHSGMTPEESRDDAWMAAIHFEDRANVAASWARVRLSDKGESIEVRRSDDMAGWLEVSFSVMRARDEVVGYVIKLTDISQRRADALALEESEELYRLVTEHARDIVCRLGLDQVPRYVSSASRAVLGFDPIEIVGKPLQHKVHEDDRDLLARHLAEVLAGGRCPDISFRMRTKDGGYRWIEASTQLVIDEASGEPTEIVATLRDIQQRHETEQLVLEASEQLRESNRLLSLAEALAQVGHWRLDTNRFSFRHSGQLAAMVGADRSAILSPRGLLRMLTRDDRRMMLATLGRARAAGRPSECSARVRTKDGQIRHFRLMVQAERDCDGRVGGLFGVVRDVTLEVRAQSDLVAARDRAKRAAAAKSAFLATMSHEIRTPMTGVLGMIDLLCLDPGAADRGRYLDTLKRSADLLMAVLDDILDFSKIESGRLTLEQRDFRFERLIEETRDLFDRSASAKGLVLRVEGLGDGAPPLRGDPVRLQQVMSNLLSNAVKFTEQGHITIRYAIMPDKARWRCRVSIADSGIGISPDERERLFEPFMQADAATARCFGGTGLGLAISRRLVEAMDGRMGVESTRGRGSTFWFEVSLDAGLEPVVQDVRLSALPEGAKRDGETGLSLLVAEDNPVNQMLLGAILTRLGHRAHIVDNGQRAVDAAENEAFDAIIMDMQMPEMDGLAATRCIRAGGGPNAAAPIIALTADASPERRRFYDGAGLSAFLTKPIDQDALADHLAAISASRMNAGMEAQAPLLDEERLSSIEAMLGSDRLVALLDLLRSQLEEAPKALAALVEQGDLEAVRREAHGLKGASANAGANRIADCAAAIEANRDTAAMKLLMDQLQAAVTATLAAIANRLAPDRKSLTQ